MCHSGIKKNKLKNKLNFPVYVCKEVWNCFSKVPNAINQWARPCPLRALENRTTEHWRTLHRKSNGNPLLHRDFFFSFTRFFLWSCRKIKYYFFLCPVRISRIMNAKKVVIRQGRQRAMETHLYTMDFFFSFTIIFQWTSRTIPYYFFYALLVFPE